MIAFHGGGVIVQPHLNGLLQQAYIGDGALAIAGVDNGILLGAGFNQGFIGVLLIFQAAHQSAAGAGDLRGVQGKTLGLCHLDGHRLEIVQKLLAAEGTTADAQTAHHFCLVSNANLPQLDPGAEHTGEILHQIAKIHPAVGGKVKQNLAAVEAVFCGNQLHVQLVVENFILADLKGMGLFVLVFLPGAAVVVRCNADDGTQGLHHLGSRNRVIALGTETVFRTTGRVDDDLVSGGNVQLAGVEKVDLSALFELHTHHGHVLRLRNGIEGGDGGIIIQGNITEGHHRGLDFLCGGIRMIVHLVTPFCSNRIIKTAWSRVNSPRNDPRCRLPVKAKRHGSEPRLHDRAFAGSIWRPDR